MISESEDLALKTKNTAEQSAGIIVGGPTSYNTRLTIKESQVKKEFFEKVAMTFHCNQYLENCMTIRASL